MQLYYPARFRPDLVKKVFFLVLLEGFVETWNTASLFPVEWLQCKLPQASRATFVYWTYNFDVLHDVSQPNLVKRFTNVADRR